MVKRRSFLLRLSPDLLDQVKAWAEQELRSVNAQIEFLLRESVKKRMNKEITKDDSDPEE